MNGIMLIIAAIAFFPVIFLLFVILGIAWNLSPLGTILVLGLIIGGGLWINSKMDREP